MNGIEINRQIYRIKKKHVKSPKIILSNSEIEILENLTIPVPHLSVARDWLIISCETAQRVSDFLDFNIGMTNKTLTHRGTEREKEIMILEFQQKKTKKLITLPLSKRVQRILIKYGNNFPTKMTSQRYNLYIKKVCELAGLNELIDGVKRDPKTNRNVRGKFPKYELITSHIGRRSFATNNYYTMNTSIIMKATGHSSEKELLNYIGKSQIENSELLAEFLDV